MVNLVVVAPRLEKLLRLVMSAFSVVIPAPEFNVRLYPPPATVPTLPKVIPLPLELMVVFPLNVTGP